METKQKSADAPTSKPILSVAHAGAGMQEVDTSKIPQDWASILEYLTLKMPYASEKLLLAGLVIKAAQVASWKRGKVRKNQYDNSLVMKCFVFLIAGSGAGKEYPQTLLEDNIFNLCFEKFTQSKIDWLAKRKADIKKEAEELYTDDPKAQKSYIKQEEDKIRLPKTEIPFATEQALYDDALACQIAGNGSIFLKIGEFGQKLRTNTPQFQELMTAMSSAYDGKFLRNSTRDCNNSDEIKDMPINALFATSHSVFKDKKCSELFNYYLETAFARRSTFVFEEEREMSEDSLSCDEKTEIDRRAQIKAANLADKIEKIYDKIPHNGIYTLDKEANGLYSAYYNEMTKLANKRIREDAPEVLKIEARERHIKALVMAGLCAVYNHPDISAVNKRDMEQGIYLTNLLNEDYEKFIYRKKPVENEYSLIFEFFKRNINKPFKKSYFTQHKEQFSLTQRQAKGKEFDQIIETIKEMAEDAGYKFETSNGNNNSTLYVLKETRLNNKGGEADDFIKTL